MNKKILYLIIYQTIGNEKAEVPLINVYDYNRNLAIHIAKNSNHNISYLTLEFTGHRARYLSSLVFDGNGDNACTLVNFAMPKTRISHMQKALVMLACLDFIISNNVIENMKSFEYFRDSICTEFANGNQALIRHYDKLKQKAEFYAKQNESFAKEHPSSNIPPSHQVVYF